jgi:hypothetical protein
MALIHFAQGEKDWLASAVGRSREIDGAEPEGGFRAAA